MQNFDKTLTGTPVARKFVSAGTDYITKYITKHLKQFPGHACDVVSTFNTMKHWEIYLHVSHVHRDICKTYRALHREKVLQFID